jgi:hypothetical protein
LCNASAVIFILPVVAITIIDPFHLISHNLGPGIIERGEDYITEVLRTLKNDTTPYS